MELIRMESIISKGWNCRCWSPLQVAEPSGVREDQSSGAGKKKLARQYWWVYVWHWKEIEKANDRNPISASSGHTDCLLTQALKYFSFFFWKHSRFAWVVVCILMHAYRPMSWWSTSMVHGIVCFTDGRGSLGSEDGGDGVSITHFHISWACL